MRSFIRWVHSLAYVIQGARAMRRHDDDGVIRNYSRAIEISPEDLDYYFARGHAHWHKREFGHAAADFSTVIDLNPGDPYAHLARGAVHRDRGYLPQAIRDLDHAISVEGAPPIAYYLRACCHAERGDDDLALADLDEVLELDPDDGEARTLQRSCLRHQAAEAAEAAKRDAA